MSLVTDEPPEQALELRRGGEPPNGPRRRGPFRALAVGAVLLGVLIGGVVGLVLERQQAYDRNIERLPDVFPDEADRPAPAAAEVDEGADTPVQNWLLVGSDSRADRDDAGDDGPRWRPGGQRADTIMLVHLPADRSRVYLVSLPRDAWVPIDGHGTAKINAALSYGGPPLLIATVEQLTGVRVDHFAMLDFAGFELMTDALGGVDVRVAETVTDPLRDVTWTAGTHRLDGEQALQFVRQRHNLPGGDFDRIKRQQAFLKGLAGRVTDRGVLTNPLQLNAFLDAATRAVSVDESVTLGGLRSLALELRSVRANDIVFMTTPVTGLGTEGDQSVVHLDAAESGRLFDALATGAVDEYAAAADSVNEVTEVR